MKKTSFLLPLFFLMLFSEISFSQEFTQNIRGVIIDKNSQSPLTGANITIIDSNPIRGATTDIDGKFKIENIAIGRVGLKISFMGYNEILLTNLNLNSGKELFLNIEMQEKIMSTKEVVITAQNDKSTTQNKMTTVSSRGFTIEETERYAGARSDVARMASNFAGVTGGTDARNDIVIRGNSPFGLLWRLEGVDIPNPNHFAAFGTTGGPICMLKNNLLANSDFMTAAFPAEYGNAISGVFDIKMINGNNEKREFVCQMGFNGIEVGAEGPISKKNGSSYLLNYRYSTLQFFEKLGIQFGTGSAIPRYQDLTFKVNIPKSKLGSFTVFGVGGKSQIAFLDSKKDTTKEKIDFYGIQGWDITNWSDMAVAGITHTYMISKSVFTRLTIAGTYHYFSTRTDSVVPVTMQTHPYEYSNLMENKLLASFYINKKINIKNNVKLGFIASKLFYNLVDSVYFAMDTAFRSKIDFKGSSYLIQPYAQWQYRLTNTITLNTGIHFQYFAFNKTFSPEPRIGLKWAFAPTQSLSLGFGKHSQMVPVSVLFNQVKMPDGTYSRTNENLDLIHSLHYVLSYDWNINEFTRVKAETYYQEVSNVPINNAANSSYSILNQGANFVVYAPDTLTNKGTGKNYGIEITLEHFLNKGLYYLATASVYDSKYKGSDGIERNTVFNGGYTVNLLVGKEFTLKPRKKDVKRIKTFDIDIKMTRSGGQRYTPIDVEQSLVQQHVVYFDDQAFSKKFPDYWRTDLKIAYKMNMKRVTAEYSIEISNIFNQKNVFNENFNRKTGQTKFTYQLGRTIIPQYRIIF
ncbi:MAG: TonB-dependent receptor [Bacteroidetes bacterium]|nr:TonB-dependent receptor [Bacteroidota bacterium]